jgi:hypothetical protein
MSIQSDIVEAVRSRGYLEGWTNEQLAARQAMKLVEEVQELSSCAGTIGDMNGSTWQEQSTAHEKLWEAGEAARLVFDCGDCGTLESTDYAKKELFDIIVVCSVLAHALGVEDMMQGALDKAQADVRRGVRK